MPDHDDTGAAETGQGVPAGDSPWPDILGGADRSGHRARQSGLITAAEFRDALQRLGYSQRDFATFVHTNERTVRRWVAGDQAVPGWAVVILGLMTKLQDRQVAFLD